MADTHYQHSVAEPSPVEHVLNELARLDPKWRIEVGDPGDGSGWIRGRDFTRGNDGPFRALLERISNRLRTNDKRTVAASFALRFGWCASVAIAPYIVGQCVPDVSLANISLKFREDTLFERTALHSPLGVKLGNSRGQASPLIRYQTDPGRLVQVLRQQLHQQARPVVEALYDWSGFSRKGSWGMITSSWASQFINVCGRLSEQPAAIPMMRDFFPGNDEVSQMQPRLHPVSMRGVTHVYQRRASCCRYYLLPQGDLCASCPLVSDEDRLKRNKEWMTQQLDRQKAR